MKITYIFTTFPQLSERFLQREIIAMRDLGVELKIVSLIGGQAEFEQVEIERFRWWQWAMLPFACLREYQRRPEAFRRLIRALRRRRPAGMINLLENLLGFAFAVTWAPRFRESQANHIHGVWATAPAAAALLLGELTATRFSLGAHAYDVFRDGGDWILEEKLQAACLIHTSTEATRKELLRRGADPARVVMIRRGLNTFPEITPVRSIYAGEPVRLLSVGRLIEKKGFDSLLWICATLRAEEIPFVCRIVGGGPLRKRLEKLCRSLGLGDCIEFTGPLPYEQVSDCYRWADLFCFAGRIATSQDRDGLPNVMAEAMSYGLPVLSAPVSGTVEAIADGVTGCLLDPGTPGEWVKVIDRLRANESLRESFGHAGRKWVEENFDARQNATRLLEAFRQIEPSLGFEI